MDSIFIDIASIDCPGSSKCICVSRNASLKSLVDLVSSELRSEVYRLYFNNKRLTDIGQLYDNGIVYAATSLSPEGSFNKGCLDDSKDISDSGTFFTNAASNLKFAVVGEKSSGKSSFIMRFVHNIFVDEYLPTYLAAEYCSSLQVEGLGYGLSILDTAEAFIKGPDRSWFRDHQLFIITIGVDQLDHWKTSVLRFLAMVRTFDPSLVFLMVTKMDLMDRLPSYEAKAAARMIRQLEVFAESKSLMVFKCSAKTNKEVSTPFSFATKRIQSFQSKQSTATSSFIDLYAKEPQLFRFFNKVLKFYKQRMCRLDI